MTKFLVVFCLAFFLGCTILDNASAEDWGLQKRGWNWFNWYYYWYWQHGSWGEVSDHDTICQRLWGVDHNRVHQRVDYDVFLQGRVLKNSSTDRADSRLFYYLRLEKLRRKPTYRTFIDLLANFQAGSTRLNADVETIETNINNFLSAVMKTRVFQELFWYLVRNGLVVPDKALFKESLLHLWFNKGNITTERLTAFQKVFVGETVVNPNKLSVRNWIQFYNLELERLNYYGHLRYFQFDPKVISVMFSWNRGVPVTDNILVGTSPEFELALYTLCFFRSPGTECECKVNINKIVVKTLASDDGRSLLNSHFEIKQ